MLEKEAILSEIRRLAAERGGKLGLRVFLKETGISPYHFLGKYWTTWNEALDEAKVGTNDFFRPNFPEQSVASSMASLIGRLGKWPSRTELRIARRDDPTFPSLSVFRRLDMLGTNVPALITQFCGEREDLASVAEIAAAQQRKHAPADPEGNKRARVQGWVYMLRSGRRYKIGHTNTPGRRHREVSVNLPDPTNLVHSIETDDPRGIERYWHERFDEKRVKGTEFFELTAGDVAAFKRRKYQ